MKYYKEIKLKDGRACVLRGATEDDAAKLSEELENDYPDIEFMVRPGMQPLYYYFISAE